jgi:hypothetical protein
MPNRPPARANAEAALRAQATRTAVDLIKDLTAAYFLAFPAFAAMLVIPVITSY